MRLIFARSSGFCMGVRSAVATAERLAGEHTYTYGELIHNDLVLERLRGLGVKAVNSLDEIPEGEDATLIIRSHGAGREVFEEAARRGLKVVDATCPFVKKIHEIVAARHEAGYRVFIIGAKDHPEVAGTNGWCEGSATVIDENFDPGTLKEGEKCCFVAQTTFSTEKYGVLIKKIREHRLKTVEIFDTICYTTVSRQNEAKELSRVCSKVLVLGSPSSSNTGKLFALCSRPGCSAYLISRADDLKTIFFSTDDVVGVIAGASTPDELITEVKEYMSENFTDAKDPEFLEALEKPLAGYKEGKRVKGTVISADENGVKLSLDGKKDGFIPKNEMNIDGSYDPADYPEGTVLEVRIGKNDTDTGCVLLSKKAVDEIREADKIVESIRGGERFEVTIDKAIDNNKGLIARLGTYSVFIPASQIEERFPRDLKKYVGKKMEVVVLKNKETGEFEINDDRHKIVAGHRTIAEEDRKAKEEVFWANVVPNTIVSGVVKRTTSFGAFVSVDGFDCLAHIKDLSWVPVKTVEEVLTVGETYEFVVLSADREKNRVSLGYKQLQPHPFVACMEKHPVGSVAHGKVTSIVSFGVFVEVEPHVEGLVHVSEVAHSYVKNLADVVKVGDEVDVKVLGYDEQAHRINLSIKACLPEEEKPAHEEGENADGKPEGERKPRKSHERKSDAETAGDTEWREDTANNPFNALLKDLDVK